MRGLQEGLLSFVSYEGAGLVDQHVVGVYTSLDEAKGAYPDTSWTELKTWDGKEIWQNDAIASGIIMIEPFELS